MATVDFVWQPNATFLSGVPVTTEYPTPLQYTSVTEGTGVQTSIPLTFTISAAQATDTVITFGVNRVHWDSTFFVFPGFTGHSEDSLAMPNFGDVNEQYDLADTFQAIIVAGQTSVTFQWNVAADNQDELDEYFNLYIASVSGGNTIDASDMLENQGRTIVTPRNPPSGPTTLWHNWGFNTFAIIDDDTPGTSGGTTRLSALPNQYTIAEGDTQPVFAGAGNDFVNGSSGDDTVLAHDDDDVVWGNGGNDTIAGGAGNDQLRGDAGADILFGGTGNDSLDGGEGDDVLWGSGATEEIGNDTISGGEGNDTILGQGGNDILTGGSGADAIAGGTGADTIMGGDGNDVVFGGAGADIIAGEAGDDVLWGEDNDGATAGNDGIDGGAGNDTILGQGGDDVLFGQTGNDAIAGGDGSDYLLGGAGADILGGGSGADVFAFSLGDNGDTIIDFNAGGLRDTIDLRSYFDATGYTGTDPRGAGLLAVYQNGADADVYLQGTLMVRIQNVTAAALDDTYFLFQ